MESAWFERLKPLLFVCALGIGGVVVAVYLILKQGSTETDPTLFNSQGNQDVSEGQALDSGPGIVVDIDGAVVHPGVFHLAEGVILDDLIKEAGGFSDGADLGYVSKNVNLAEELIDHQKIYVPFEGESTSPSGVDNEGSSSDSGGKVSINNASREQLDTLPGIGPVTAQKIIDSRPYKTLEDLKEVDGIGDSTFEKIKEQIIL